MSNVTRNHKDNVFCLLYKDKKNLYEQQASVNPNMPLRDLYYVVEELKKIAPPRSLYSTAKVKIPTPRFVMFYNGTVKQPERRVYRLSELFSRKEEKPDLWGRPGRRKKTE